MGSKLRDDQTDEHSKKYEMIVAVNRGESLNWISQRQNLEKIRWIGDERTNDLTCIVICVVSSSMSSQDDQATA